jgi:hypothetical protein
MQIMTSFRAIERITLAVPPPDPPSAEAMLANRLTSLADDVRRGRASSTDCALIRALLACLIVADDDRRP